MVIILNLIFKGFRILQRISNTSTPRIQHIYWWVLTNERREWKICTMTETDYLATLLVRVTTAIARPFGFSSPELPWTILNNVSIVSHWINVQYCSGLEKPKRLVRISDTTSCATRTNKVVVFMTVDNNYQIEINSRFEKSLRW